MNKKIVVENRSEALKLIESGINSMLIFSEEAPHGYKKDGTPAAPRGRKPLDPAVKAAREAKSAASGRKKPGPIVRTEDAPFGVKADGTPMKKRGRPSKASKELPALAPVPVTEEPTTAPVAEETAMAEMAASPTGELLTEITMDAPAADPVAEDAVSNIG